MAFANPSNTGRVERMIADLGLIEKSALANRAGAGEVAAMLAPLIEKLAAYAAPVAAEPAVPTMPPRPGSHRAYNSIREAAENCDLADFTIAMAIYHNRLTDHFEGRD